VMECKTKQCGCIQKGCGKQCGCYNCENAVSRNPTSKVIITHLKRLSSLHTYTLKELQFICIKNKISTRNKNKEQLKELLRKVIVYLYLYLYFHFVIFSYFYIFIFSYFYIFHIFIFFIFLYFSYFYIFHILYFSYFYIFLFLYFHIFIFSYFFFF
jgi:hypothetical protein